MLEIVELNHGELKARLLFCNRAYRNARHELGSLLDFDDLKSSISQLNFLMSYLYESYLAACLDDKVPALIKRSFFDECISMTQTEEGSNLTEIIKKAGDSITTYVGVEVENLKKKMEELKKSQPTTNSNSSFAGSLDTNLTNSGMDSPGVVPTTSSKAITSE